MPIYEYRCQECGAAFDKFVRSFAAASALEVECPHCKSKRCQKTISLFGTSSAESGASSSAGACAPTGG